MALWPHLRASFCICSLDVVWPLVGAALSAIHWSGGTRGKGANAKTGVPRAGKAVIPWPHCETFWVLGSPCACPTSLAAFHGGEVCVRQGGGQQYSSRLAAHQWATSSSGNLRMRVWVAQWAAQWQAPPMMQRLLSKEWICFHQGAGMGHGQGARGAGKGVEWSGVDWANGRGELERQDRQGKPPTS
jgi:hypothetical protein